MVDSTTHQDGRRRFLNHAICGAAAIFAGANCAQAEPLVTTASELLEVNRIELASRAARRIVARPDGGVWLAADRSVQHLATNGDLQARIELSRPARCLAMGQDAIFVGVRNVVLKFNAAGDKVWESPSIGSGHLIGDINVENTQLTVTDITSGHRLQMSMSEPTSTWSSLHTQTELKVSSSSRLVRHASDQWLITEPGRHRVVVFDDAGRKVSTWGSRSRNIDGFQGCCNPMAIAELPDGSWVTAEAGQVRIKRFDANGQFMYQIAGPDSIPMFATLESEDTSLRCRIGGIDLATSPSGDLWVLHAAARQIIHYRPRV